RPSMQHLVGFNRSHRARSPPGGRISAPGAIDFRAQNATFCVTAQRRSRTCGPRRTAVTRALPQERCQSPIKIRRCSISGGAAYLYTKSRLGERPVLHVMPVIFLSFRPALVRLDRSEERRVGKE